MMIYVCHKVWMWIRRFLSRVDRILDEFDRETLEDSNEMLA